MKYFLALAGVAALSGIGTFQAMRMANYGADRAPAGGDPTPCPIPPNPDDMPDILPNPPTEPLHCVFNAEGIAESIADYDPANGVVVTTTGSPPTQQTFSNVAILSGLPPYGNDGLTVVAFGDVPLFHVMTQSQDGNFPATWGQAPGGPTNVLNAGICTVVGDEDDDDDDHECKDPRHHHMKRHKHHKHHRHHKNCRHPSHKKHRAVGQGDDHKDNSKHHH